MDRTMNTRLSEYHGTVHVSNPSYSTDGCVVLPPEVFTSQNNNSVATLRSVPRNKTISFTSLKKIQHFDTSPFTKSAQLDKYKVFIEKADIKKTPKRNSVGLCHTFIQPFQKKDDNENNLEDDNSSPINVIHLPTVPQKETRQSLTVQKREEGDMSLSDISSFSLGGNTESDYSDDSGNQNVAQKKSYRASSSLFARK